MGGKLLALDSSALPGRVDTMVVACDAPACLLRQLVCASTRPGLFESRIDSTGVDAQPWEPSEAARLIPTPGTFKSAPYAGLAH